VAFLSGSRGFQPHSSSETSALVFQQFSLRRSYMYNPLGWHLQYLTYCIGNFLSRRPELETSLALILTWLFVLDKPVSCVHAVTVNPLLVDFTRLYQLRQDGGSFRISVSKYARNQEVDLQFLSKSKRKWIPNASPRQKSVTFRIYVCLDFVHRLVLWTQRGVSETSGI